MLRAMQWPSHSDRAAFDHTRIQQQELALIAKPDSDYRVLFIPALLGEANKMRRFTVQTMRALAGHGIGSILPDLPGTNESLAALADQTLPAWQGAMDSAVQHFRATHSVTVRAGCLAASAAVPILSYAPLSGASLIQGLLRIHSLSEREAGRDPRRDTLHQTGRHQGLRIAGFDLSATLYTQLADAEPVAAERILATSDLGSAGLWLRAEPAEATAQSQLLADRIAAWIT